MSTYKVVSLLHGIVECFPNFDYSSVRLPLSANLGRSCLALCSLSIFTPPPFIHLLSVHLTPFTCISICVTMCVYIHTCPSPNSSVSAFPFGQIPTFIPHHLHLHLSGDIPLVTSIKTFFLRFVVYQTVTHSSVSSAFLFVILPGSRTLSHTWRPLCVFSL
jgi:hypothetical protein